MKKLILTVIVAIAGWLGMQAQSTPAPEKYNEFIEQILREQDEADGSGSLLDDIPEVLKYAEKTSASSETVFFDLRKYDEDNSIDEQ